MPDNRQENHSKEADTKDARDTKDAKPKGVAKLADGAHMKDVIAKVNEVVDLVNTRGKRDRGPDSTRVMTEDDAKRMMLGDLKEMSHSKVAETLGLSYGQVYSARKGFTFKGIYKESDKRW